MSKHVYEELEVVIISFDGKDIIRTSLAGDNFGAVIPGWLEGIKEEGFEE
jgi:hypothetical protein